MRIFKPLNYANLTILGFDPSTDVTGIAAIRFLDGVPQSPETKAIDATGSTPGVAKSRTDLAARIARIGFTTEEATRFIASLSFPLDAVATEQDTNRGFEATCALHWATGAYITIPALRGIRPYQITRQQACIACSHDVFSVYRQSAGRTDEEKAAKRARLKQAVLDWARAKFPDLDLSDDRREESEAIADALAVTVACYAEITGTQIAPPVSYGGRGRGASSKGGNKSRRAPAGARIATAI